MRITRLYLRNYRVFEEPLEIEIPPGLVGIYGRNGAGKSTLLESILFSLYGKARTAKDEIRTAGVNADCVTEVEFEHEGHLYLVRRTIAGQAATVRAQAFADGAQVAEGVRDTSRYVHSVLGMDDVSFRASVFAEQKQLAAFSSHQPAERRRLVLQLLGITPLDGAREAARKDARDAGAQLERLRRMLPDRSQLEAAVAEAAEAAAASVTAAESADLRAAEAAKLREEAEGAAQGLAEVASEHEGLVKEGKSLREQRDRLAARIETLKAELSELAAAAERTQELIARSEGLAAAEAELELVRRATAAAVALAATPAPKRPAEPDEQGYELLMAEATEAARQVAELEGQITAAGAELRRAQSVLEPAAELSGEADCPVCGQALGDAFETVKSHRMEECKQAERRLETLSKQRQSAAEKAKARKAKADAAAAELKAARQALASFEVAAARRLQVEAAFDEAVQALGRVPEEGEVGSLTAVVEKGRAAAAEWSRLQGRLERRAAAEAELAADSDHLADLDGRLQNLREKVKALGFQPDALAAARATALEAKAHHERLSGEARSAAALQAAATARLEAEQRRLADAVTAHAELADAEDSARHLSRLAELLNGFRNAVVASVGPRLSTQAADLFAELTDHEYDRLEVDPDSYEIQIRDAGVSYGMDRFSGSETDLANLALRVAISEQVRFQSGGAVGLLVLDEVFGPLDEER